MSLSQLQRGMMLFALVSTAAGCSAARTGRAPTVGDYDYCVVSEADAHGYAGQARSILSQAFVVIDEYDPRLQSSAVRQRTCVIEIRWQRGFWYTPVWVELRDLDSEQLVMRSEVSGPGLWSGVSAAVPLALQDIAAARRSAGPLYAEGERPAGLVDSELPERERGHTTAEPLPGRSKTERLRELHQLREQGLISEQEYEEERGYIIRE